MTFFEATTTDTCAFRKIYVWAENEEQARTSVEAILEKEHAVNKGIVLKTLFHAWSKSFVAMVDPMGWQSAPSVPSLDDSQAS